MCLLSKRIFFACTLILVYLLLFLYRSCLTRSGLQIQEILFKNLRNIVSPVRNGSSMKYILQWTKSYNTPFVYWGEGQDIFIERKCKVDNCYVTSYRWLLPSITEFDAVAFGRELTSYALPTNRSPHQKYVYVAMESSHYYPICTTSYEGYFNWTWTYRLDSDQYYGYITIRNITGDIIGPRTIMHWMKLDSMLPVDNKTKLLLEKKKKAAAWFVSNCRTLSKREVFAITLKQNLHKYGLELDIFGNCRWAPKKCSRSKRNDCLKIIQEDYYFYLALENSLSEDYVTEKLLMALKNYAVPIVYGGANYTRFMPVGIYLHGGELKPPDLAKEINDIIKDKNRYYNFFKWRNHYSYHHTYEAPDSDDHCRICEMLHDETLMNKTTVYADFGKWWNAPGACSYYQTGLQFFNFFNAR